MTTTVADVMAPTLKASGVRRVYGIPRTPKTGSPTRCGGPARSPDSMSGTRRPDVDPRGAVAQRRYDPMPQSGGRRMQGNPLW